MANQNDELKRQTEMLNTAKITALQTYIIMFNRTRKARARVKWLGFLGIAVPLILGGVVLTFYTQGKPPDALIAVGGALSLAQVVMSLWSLSDSWDPKLKKSEEATAEFSQLRLELDAFYPLGTTGLYDEDRLRQLLDRSRRGLFADNELNVSQHERDSAWAEAKQRVLQIS
jgi:mobilome CxxCx(11)CxxC protein